MKVRTPVFYALYGIEAGPQPEGNKPLMIKHPASSERNQSKPFCFVNKSRRGAVRKITCTRIDHVNSGSSMLHAL